MDRLHDLKAAGVISSSHFSGAAEGGTRGVGAVLLRILRAAMSACSVVIACCCTVMVCLACWSSGLRLRGTADVEALGVERGDWRGGGILKYCRYTPWYHCAM